MKRECGRHILCLLCSHPSPWLFDTFSPTGRYQPQSSERSRKLLCPSATRARQAKVRVFKPCSMENPGGTLNRNYFWIRFWIRLGFWTFSFANWFPQYAPPLRWINLASRPGPASPHTRTLKQKYMLKNKQWSDDPRGMPPSKPIKVCTYPLLKLALTNFKPEQAGGQFQRGVIK